MKNSRRDFLKKGALAGFSALMIPEIAKAAVKENTSVHAPKINLKKDCVILFQGDSITDCGRDRNSNRCNTMEQFGSGYVLFTATQLLEGKRLCSRRFTIAASAAIKSINFVNAGRSTVLLSSRMS